MRFNCLRMKSPVSWMTLFEKAYHSELPCGASESYLRGWLGSWKMKLHVFLAGLKVSHFHQRDLALRDNHEGSTS